MKRFKVLLVFVLLIMFCHNPFHKLNASPSSEEERREIMQSKNDLFSEITSFYELISLTESRSGNSFQALPLPPDWAEAHQVWWYSDLATFWFWNEGQTMYIHVSPSSSFFLCGGQFSVIQSVTQYGEIKIETEGGDSFCDDLLIAQTFYFTQWSFVSDRFDPTQPLTIVFDGGSAGDQFIDYTPNTNTTSTSTTSTTIQVTTTTTTTTPPPTTTVPSPTTTPPGTTTTTTVVPSTTTVPRLTTTTTTVQPVPDTFSISGKVSGDVINISIALSGTASMTIKTNVVTGEYEFSDLASGYYTITPIMDGYSFIPTNYEIQNLNTDLYNMDFVSTRLEPVSPCALELIYDEDSEEVKVLRYIRDNVLSQTSEGQEIIRLYYEWSPVIVKAMEEDEEFKEDVKEMIDEVLTLLK